MDSWLNIGMENIFQNEKFICAQHGNAVDIGTDWLRMFVETFDDDSGMCVDCYAAASAVLRQRGMLPN